MAEVRCDNLVREFVPGVRAVDDVTLSVGDGELVVLVGPSGCGKSTLLRIVAGLETADSGSVSIGGIDVSDLSPPERNVAMVFQDYALYPHMTVRRNLEFPLRVRGDTAAERSAKVARISSMLGLEPLLERLPKELSGGQRQRVAMGRALVREPAVSLLDEPLSNLDAKLRSEVRAEIAELQQRTRTTMLYVTHDQVEAMTLGHRVAVLDRGVLLQAAPPGELYDRPVNAFVASFIGNPPMNLLPASAADGVATVTGTAECVRIERSRKIAERSNPAVAARIAQIGVRPEALSLASSDTADAWDAQVEHVELLGHETLVHARLGTDADGKAAAGRRAETLIDAAPAVADATPAALRVIARVPGTHRLAAGEKVRLALDPEAVYLFDERGDTL